MVLPTVTGFEKSGIVSNEDVERILRELPEQHRSSPHLAEITYIDQVGVYDPGDRRQAPDQIYGACHIDAARGIARIEIFRQDFDGNHDPREFIDSILHEVGHVVYRFILDDEERQAWHILHAEADRHLAIAGRDPVEHFAETYSTFILHQRFVEGYFPKEHSFMEAGPFSSGWKPGGKPWLDFR